MLLRQDKQRPPEMALGRNLILKVTFNISYGCFILNDQFIEFKFKHNLLLIYCSLLSNIILTFSEYLSDESSCFSEEETEDRLAESAPEYKLNILSENECQEPDSVNDKLTHDKYEYILETNIKLWKSSIKRRESTGSEDSSSAFSDVGIGPP